MSKNSNITFTRLSVVAKPNEFVKYTLQIHWVYLFVHLRADFKLQKCGLLLLYKDEPATSLR